MNKQAAIAAVLHGKRGLHHLELSPQEWHDLEDLIKLLEPFTNATEVLSGQKYPILSCLGPILADLKEKIEDDPLDSRTMKLAKQAKIDLSARYQDSNVLEMMNKVVFLDSRFKNSCTLICKYNRGHNSVNSKRNDELATTGFTRSRPIKRIYDKKLMNNYLPQEKKKFIP